jgi:RimJ/RimL family protein N-acetyltransferase
MNTIKFPETLEGRFIMLKRMTVDDAEIIYHWRTSLSGRYLNKPESYSVETQKNWIRNRPSEEINFIIFEKKTNEKIGTISICDVNWQNKIVDAGRLLLDEKFLKKSNPYGLEALKITACFVFERMKFHKISGTILSLNTNMYKLQTYLGFKQEGYLKSHTNIDGQYYDLYIMSLFADDYLGYKSKIDILLRPF